jgi:O-antigen ligase
MGSDVPGIQPPARWQGILRIALIIGAIAAASLWGLGLAGGVFTTLLVPVVALLVLGFVTLAAPVEWILLFSLVAVLLADTYFWPRGVDFYYTRFVPSGMLAIRSIIALAARQASLRDLPGIFLKPFGLLFVFALLSATYSTNPQVTLLRSASMLFMLVGFGIAVPIYMPTEAKQRAVLRLLLVPQVLSIVLSIVWFLMGSENAVTDFGAYTRIQGLFKNVNTLGLVSMLTFFPLVGWWQEAPRHRKWLSSILILLTLFTLVMSGSRASFLGLLAGMFVYSMSDSTLKGRFRLALLSTLAIMFLVLVMFPAEFLPGLLRTDPGLRFFVWEKTLAVGLQSPVMGFGFGTVEVLTDLTRQIAEANPAEFYSGPHSSILLLFVHLGILGVAIASLGFIAIMRRVPALFEKEAPTPMVLSLYAVVAAGLVNAFFESWLFGFGGASAFPFWFYLALLALYVHKNQAVQRRPAA